jgi:hypothetical protein
MVSSVGTDHSNIYRFHSTVNTNTRLAKPEATMLNILKSNITCLELTDKGLLQNSLWTFFKDVGRNAEETPQPPTSEGTAGL